MSWSLIGVKGLSELYVSRYSGENLNAASFWVK